MTNYRYLALLICAFSLNAAADHRPQADWSWHVLSSGISESRMSLYKRDLLFGIFNFSCDLTDAGAGDNTDSNASLDLVKIDSNPEGLLVITCNVGAHSQQLNIIDLAKKASQPVFSKTGSYIAGWEIQDGELWLSYDQPCESGISVECPDGFETIFEQYPGP
jgi:hypothetical protein